MIIRYLKYACMAIESQILGVIIYSQNKLRVMCFVIYPVTRKISQSWRSSFFHNKLPHGL